MTTAVQLAQSVAPGVSLGFKNRLINPGMTIDQRNDGAAITPTNGQYSLDRWKCWQAAASKYTIGQYSTAPVGFTKSIGVSSNSSYSVGADEYFSVSQIIEGFNVADLGWGTANAKTVTLSFQVRSSLTGSFGGAINNANLTRSYPFSYTISSADTWTTVSVTVPGDTTGTWNTDNSGGIYVWFSLGSGANNVGTANAWAGTWYTAPSGSVSVVGTSGANWYITGVQLEVGTAATSFEFRDYGRELIMCQRYYEKMSFAASKDICVAYANQSNRSQTGGIVSFKVEKRASATAGSSAGSTFRYGWLGSSVQGNSILAVGANTLTGTLLLGLPSDPGTVAGYYTVDGSSTAYLDFTAEL